ncbi:MAG TPA: T9SS type B sorting domain-containing protein [Bacteroidetes bacterium]|nr:T9SS type B sorting domain-containing protein [Bacteroidota bacterium]
MSFKTFTYQLCILFLFNSKVLFAQTTPPDLKCATVQVNSDVLLEWHNDPNVCFPINIYASQNINGPYSLIGTITATGTTSFTHVGANGSSVAWYYYIESDTSCFGNSGVTSDTITNIDPVEPDILKVSVDNGNTISIEWEISPSAKTNAYIIYWDQNANNTFTPIDTVWGRYNTSTTHISSPSQRTETYTVASMDSCLNTGPYNNNTHNTILLEDTVDRCGPSMNLNWSAYNDWPDGVDKYNLLLGLNGQPESQVAQVSNTSLTYEYTSINDGDQVCFRIEAVSNSGIISYSNQICKNINIVQPPSYTYISNVSVSNGVDIDVEYYIDKSADIKLFQIYRKEGDGNFKILAENKTFSTLNQVFKYTDQYDANNNNIDISTFYYQYEIRPKDSCNTFYSSNISRSINLDGEAKYNYSNNLTWNSYFKWIGKVDYYEIYRKDNSGTWVFLNNISSTDTFYSDDISNIIDDDGIFCYKIVATEGLNLQNANYNITQNPQSHSNEVCVTQWPPIHMPNAFTPLGNNPEFKPSLLYIDDQSYSLKVLDRWGKVIYESKDPQVGWSGQFDGKDMPHGVYVYYLEFTNPDNTTYKKWGSFVLVR